MNQKISKKQLDDLINKVQQETKEDLSNKLEEIYGPKRQVSLDEFAQEVIPKLLSATFAIAGRHAEYLIHDVLSELDLLIDDEHNDSSD